jgi:hypothetical protein
MPSVGFEPAISTSERPQTYALERTATSIWRRNSSVISMQLMVSHAAVAHYLEFLLVQGR